MKVLLLGGTGAMGKHLVECLNKDDNEIYVTSRVYHSNKAKVSYIQGDAMDGAFLKDILQNDYDCIVDFMVYTDSELELRLDVLCRATRQYLFLSSARVYSPTSYPITEKSRRLIDESDDLEYLATKEYGLTKARQENILFNSQYNNWTIIRPYITYSEERLQLGVMEKEDWLYRAIHGRSIVFSKDILPHITTLSYGADVAKYIYGLVGKWNTLGEVYQIAPAKACTWQEILETYVNTVEKVMGTTPNVVLKNFAYDMGYSKNNYQVKYDRITDRRFDNSKIFDTVEMIGSIMPTHSGISMCCEKFLRNPEFRGINWRRQALIDRSVNERTRLSEIKRKRAKIGYLIYRYLPICEIEEIVKSGVGIVKTHLDK